MMIHNTLFLTTQGSYAHLDHETVVVESDGTVLIRVPLHHLGSIVAYGNILLSPYLIHRFADTGRSISWMSESGKFKAQIRGATAGNVLLRMAQHRAVEQSGIVIAQRLVWAKILNQRQIYMRAAREANDPRKKEQFVKISRMLKILADIVPRTEDMNRLRGVEGMAARLYFRHFKLLILKDPENWGMKGRNRRPPRDGINALLSFGYALLRSECQSACEVVGLDPQEGYLHALRPGRPALALDLMEEHRSHFVDRLVLSLVNRGQIHVGDFNFYMGGRVELTDESRRKFLAAYQQKKRETVRHEAIGQTIPFGLLPIVQARILARALREDLAMYQPFLYR
ncbi:MAG: type I-C CRISPR-associated endonuclease Cas1c [Firmicutes bacterium]|nr:type I-C CRISPR-associated endonuclease Cas1c [Bacillota bacterium]